MGQYDQRNQQLGIIIVSLLVAAIIFGVMFYTGDTDLGLQLLIGAFLAGLAISAVLSLILALFNRLRGPRYPR